MLLQLRRRYQAMRRRLHRRITLLLRHRLHGQLRVFEWDLLEYCLPRRVQDLWLDMRRDLSVLHKWASGLPRLQRLQ